jgi:hypothetical protein
MKASMRNIPGPWLVSHASHVTLSKKAKSEIVIGGPN